MRSGQESLCDWAPPPTPHQAGGTRRLCLTFSVGYDAGFSFHSGVKAQKLVEAYRSFPRGSLLSCQGDTPVVSDAGFSFHSGMKAKKLVYYFVTSYIAMSCTAYAPSVPASSDQSSARPPDFWHSPRSGWAYRNIKHQTSLPRGCLFHSHLPLYLSLI